MIKNPDQDKTSFLEDGKKSWSGEKYLFANGKDYQCEEQQLSFAL